MSGSSELLKSKKAAVIVSYIMLICNSLSSLLLTPLYLRFLGLDKYGLYQMVYSAAHYILILDLGISTTMVKYISLYRIQKDKAAEENFAAHCLAIVAVIIVVVVIIGLILNSYLTTIYRTISAEDAPVAHAVFLILVATTALTIVEHYFQGVVIAHEHFLVQKVVALCKIVGKVLFTVLFLYLHRGLTMIASVELILTLCSLAFLLAYGFGRLHFRVKFRRFDRNLLLGVFSFMLAIFLQSIVAYVNNTVDKTILGIMVSPAAVAVYAVAMSFITLFNSLPSAFTGVYLPQATRLINQKADATALTDFIIRPGRYQFLICGTIIAVFLLFGREFIALWSGADTDAAWIIALIIMVPNMIPLIEAVIEPVLDALGKRLYRSVVLCIMSAVNVLLTVHLVKRYGMLGAPIGTALSYLLGYGLVMNLYYQRVIKIQVLRMFGNIVSRTWICILFPALLCIPLNRLLPMPSWGGLLLKTACFLALLTAAMLLFGFRSSEKEDLRSVLLRLHVLKKKDK